MPPVEQRRTARHSVERCAALVRRKRLFFWEKTSTRASIVDLSTMGIGFYTRQGLRPGDVIRVAFEAPKELTAAAAGVEIAAEVRWVNPAQSEAGLFRVGCAFGPLKPAQNDLITRIIQTCDVRQT